MKNRQNLFFIVLSLPLLASILVFCGARNKKDDVRLNKAIQDKNVAALSAYLKEEGSDGENAKLKKMRDSLVFDSIKLINSKEAYQYFVDNYPDAEEIDFAKKRLKALGDISIEIGSFRGDESRNYYGNRAPSSLNEIWKIALGSGQSFAYGKMYTWVGAGWTGQPLVVIENGKKFLIQGCFDYNIKKIDMQTGALIWKYKMGDIIKGTGTVYYNPNATSEDEKCLVMQGSRRGEGTKDGTATSFRCVSFSTGKEKWRINSIKTDCYSRDCDGSALVVGDTAYLGLENGIFKVFNPDPQKATVQEGILQPHFYQECMLYEKSDISAHGGNLVTESSPTRLGNRIYVASGSGHIYGYNLKTKKIDWEFFTGSDIDGTPVVTDDSCIIVTLEKQYIKGKGGTYKLNPRKTGKDCVVWFFPVQDLHLFDWDGGIIGTAAVNDRYIDKTDKHLAAFTAIDGNLYVVDHKSVDKQVLGSDGITYYNSPKLVFKQRIGSAISSPIIVGNKLVAACYGGIFLFEYDKNMNFKLLAKKTDASFESSPIAYDGRIYIASNTTGYLYCLGDK